MLPQGDARIFLAARRGSSHTQWHQSFHTLHYGSFSDAARDIFGRLLMLNDDTLAPAAVAGHSLEIEATILLLPLVGALRYNCGLDQGSLDVGQAHLLQVMPGDELEITNPYEGEAINYLFIALEMFNATGNARASFDITNNPNTLVSLFTDEQRSVAGVDNIQLGKFDGRKEEIVTFQSPQDIFVFVVEGAFEVQSRLLQARDGLALKKINELDFESLSNEAIILVMEV